MLGPSRGFRRGSAGARRAPATPRRERDGPGSSDTLRMASSSASSAPRRRPRGARCGAGRSRAREDRRRCRAGCRPSRSRSSRDTGSRTIDEARGRQRGAGQRRLARLVVFADERLYRRGTSPGLTKRDLQEQLWGLARLPEDHFAADFANMERAAGRGADGMLWRTEGPERIHIVVAGGPGPQDVYIAAGLPQTRLIRG